VDALCLSTLLCQELQMAAFWQMVGYQDVVLRTGRFTNLI